jgi:thiol-disulfide isomerase/thioredoxin
MLATQVFRSIPELGGVCRQEAPRRGIAGRGVVVAFLVGEGRWWGDTPESTGTPKSQSLLALGQPAPDVVAHESDGPSLALCDDRGRPVIIQVGAPWCAPCRQEMRALQPVDDAHTTTGLAVLAVSQDQQEMREAVRALHHGMCRAGAGAPAGTHVRGGDAAGRCGRRPELTSELSRVPLASSFITRDFPRSKILYHSLVLKTVACATLPPPLARISF